MRLDYFELIDQIIDLSNVDEKIVIRASVPNESTIFEGHFPGHPLVPGVLLIEAMAQASGYLILALNEFQQMPFLVQVKEAKLRTFVLPGSELVVDASREHDGSGYAVTRTSIQCDGKKICNAQLVFRLMPYPVQELEKYVRKRAENLGLQTVGS